MTSTSRGTSRYLMEYDNQKSQEWLRRRKLRLAQVRKQSNEIARSLRQKIMNDEKMRLDKYDRMSEANFREWKADKMNELDWKLKCALDEFGDGYKLAEAEPDPDVVREELNKINFVNAQKRGEIAQQEAQRVKKQTEERKMSPINRKKLTRKKEDLRSALVRCVTVKKSAGDVKDVEEEVPYPEKNPISRVPMEKHTPEKSHISRVATEKHTPEKSHVSRVTTEKHTPEKSHIFRVAVEKHTHEKAPVSRPTKKVGKQTKGSNYLDVKKKSGKVKKKKGVSQKSCLCKNKSASSESFPRNNETIWINLNEIQSSSTGELGLRPSCSESLLSYNKHHRNRPEGTVEFYDFTSRFHCRTFREFPHLVERMNSAELREPNANELAEMESKNVEEEAKKREETEMLIQDRGMEALRREKINRDYNNLVSKLEELYKKEKVLKTQQKSQPSFLHMSEERISDRLRARQRLMDSKFEKLYYQATSEPPARDSPSVEACPRQGGGDWADVEDEAQTPLSLSPSTFKPNTPVKMDDDVSQKSSRKGLSRREKTKQKKQLLEDIEKTLQEGRELRKSASRSQELSDVEVEESEKENPSSESETEASPVCTENPPQPTTRSQECQTENLKAEGNAEEIDVSLPVSTSTCYKSPPSVLGSHRVQKFLDYLEGISETEDSDLAEEKQTLKKKIDKLMYDLVRSSDSSKSVENEKKIEETEEKSDENLTLEYYVAKLLTMSRECIANLSVSSENVSTPNVTDLEYIETKCNHKFSPVEDLIRQSRLRRADSLEEMIKNWQRVLEKDSEKDTTPEPEDVPDCPTPREPRHEPERTLNNVPKEPSSVVYTPKMSKFEEITKKCSERISELSEMLDKVRKDKEKLLSSASGDSSLSVKDGKDSVKDLEEDDASALLNTFVKKNSLEAPEEKSLLMAVDWQTKDLEESFESWPDVMEELLKKNILASPFKWSDGEHSSDFTTTVDNLQPSSIETVIGNFRKEISKIKPFTLSESNTSEKQRCGSSEESYHGLSSSPRKKVSSRPSARERRFPEETSVESINQALTSLGLNWAKSFLRKNEESKAINSSSNSERKSSDSEEDAYP